MTHDTTGGSNMYSVMYRNVRMDTCKTWPDARESLRVSINLRKPGYTFPNTDRARYADTLNGHLAELMNATDPRETDSGHLWLSEWDGIVYKPGEDTFGVSTGDLALIVDYSNGCQWWTIQVKCRVERVWFYDGKPVVDIQVTGKSSQFRQGERRSAIPAGFIRPRHK